MATETHDLRRRVLRAADPDAVVTWEGDDEPTSFHLGVRDAAGDVIAVSTWVVQSDGTQLRGMASEPGWAGKGMGSLLLAAGIERCRGRGDRLVWANARVTAIGFYRRAGFDVIGDEFVTPDTGLPHRRVHFLL